MNVVKTLSLLISLVCILNISHGTWAQSTYLGQVTTAEITCGEALRNVEKLEISLIDTSVFALLGKPKIIDNGVWIYNFLECTPPPKAGTQTIIGLCVSFTEKTVAKIEFATVCATGPKK